MKTEKKYEQWKAITESDFVTLFIKTWFTYMQNCFAAGKVWIDSILDGTL